MPQTSRMTAPRPGRSLLANERELQPVAKLGPDADQNHGTLAETLNRYLALQLMLQHLPTSDIRFLCDVPEYFLKRIFDDLRFRQGSDGREHKRHGGSSPGVWSLCSRPATRMEAALFTGDWIKVGLPFVSRPDPNSLCHALQRYRHWGWGDERRQPLPANACLALVRLVGSGELTLAACLLCRHPFVYPADRSPVAASKLCPFCASPHAKACNLTVDRRALFSR